MYVGETKPKGSVVQTAHQQPALWVVYVAGAIPVTAVAFPLPVGTTPIGRKPGQGGLALDDEHMSRAHAELTVADDGTAMIRDLGSVNGTFVDGVSRHEMAESFREQGDRLSGRARQRVELYRGVLREERELKIRSFKAQKGHIQDALDLVLVIVVNKCFHKWLAKSEALIVARNICGFHVPLRY